MSALDYPPPAHAGYVWYRGDALMLAFPGENGSGHTICIPLEKLAIGREADQRGWLIFLETLRARATSAQQSRRPQLGTPDTPTRTQVEALLAGQRGKAYDVRGREKIGDLWEDEDASREEDVG